MALATYSNQNPDIAAKIADKPSLVENFRNGGEAAFRELVEKYQWRLYCCALKILKKKEDAEDAVADTFAIAFKERKKFRGEAGLYTWLWKICFSVCYHKASRKHLALFSLDEISAASGGTAADSYGFAAPPAFVRPRFIFSKIAARQEETATLKSLVRGAVAKLSRDHKRIVILKDFYDYSYDEIATMLAVSRGTVMSRLSRARYRLKELLKETIL